MTERDPRLDLPLRTAADTEGDVSRVLGKLEGSGKDLRILRVLANSPGMFRPFVLMADALLRRSKLPAKEREVVIMHLAAQRGVPYEWAEHVPMAAEAGVSDEQLAALSSGTLDDLTLFSPTEQLSLRAAREIADGALSEARWNELNDAIGEGAALDLLLTVAWWGAFVPMIIETVGLVSPAPDTGG